MYVKDNKDVTGVIKRTKETSRTIEKEHEFQFAWDKQAVFLQAQSRAMAELRNMIKQYDELCKSDMATEEQKARIDKLRVDIEKTKAETKQEGHATTITIVDEWLEEDDE